MIRFIDEVSTWTEQGAVVASAIVSARHATVVGLVECFADYRVRNT